MGCCRARCRAPPCAVASWRPRGQHRAHGRTGQSAAACLGNDPVAQLAHRGVGIDYRRAGGGRRGMPGQAQRHLAERSVVAGDADGTRWPAGLGSLALDPGGHVVAHARPPRDVLLGGHRDDRRRVGRPPGSQRDLGLGHSADDTKRREGGAARGVVVGTAPRPRRSSHERHDTQLDPARPRDDAPPRSEAGLSAGRAVSEQAARLLAVVGLAGIAVIHVLDARGAGLDVRRGRGAQPEPRPPGSGESLVRATAPR